MPEPAFAYSCDEHRGEGMVPLHETLVWILDHLPDGAPPPDLGNARLDTCVLCSRETDTGLSFSGDVEWVIAGLIVLGVREEQATLMVSTATGTEAGMLPDGEIILPVRVCRRCAVSGGARLPVGLISCVIPDIAQTEGTQGAP